MWGEVAEGPVGLEGGRRGPGGVPPGPATRGKGEGDQVGDQRVITDHPPDHPLRSPSLGTKKVIRQGITPFGTYIILYRGGGRGGGFCLSTRGPSIVQGPTFQTGPLPEMGWSPLLGMVGWISGARPAARCTKPVRRYTPGREACASKPKIQNIPSCRPESLKTPVDSEADQVASSWLQVQDPHILLRNLVNHLIATI